MTAPRRVITGDIAWLQPVTLIAAILIGRLNVTSWKNDT
jgi:hypothetical protein